MSSVSSSRIPKALPPDAAAVWLLPIDGGEAGMPLDSAPVGRRAKRLMDLGAVLALALLSAPVCLLAAIAIRLESRGPVFFRQERLGRHGRRFMALKFRTMHVDAEDRLDAMLDAADPEQTDEFRRYRKLRRDPRVTRVGRLLRALSIDELPQLWNVLRGEMSLVGPRPYLVSEAPLMNGAERLILQVRPGITGLWQVSGRNAVPFAGRLELEQRYVRTWSLWQDLKIIARTPLAVIRRDGAY